MTEPSFRYAAQADVPALVELIERAGRLGAQRFACALL